MGKSNSYVIPWYRNKLGNLNYDSVIFLGLAGPDEFSDSIISNSKKYYDLTLDNWKINDEWDIDKECADLVICTRCPYFASNPKLFVKKCFDIVKPGGVVFLDWGLGDHWRKIPYKVGWLKEGLHESIQYNNHVSKLYSCFWDQTLENDENVLKFKEWIKQFGYRGDLTHIVYDEVPVVLTKNDLDIQPIISTLALWPEAPQLYISTYFVKPL